MADTDKAKEKRRAARRRRRRITFGLFVVMAAALAFLGTQYQSLREENARLADPQAAAEADSVELLNKVSQLIDLPTDESPTIATVVDASKLNSQEFFSKAENGDRVIIYATAKKAILYRPSTNKIVEVAPVNIGQPTEQSGTESTSESGQSEPAQAEN